MNSSEGNWPPRERFDGNVVGIEALYQSEICTDI
jgi:hypothetical protein